MLLIWLCILPEHLAATGSEELARSSRSPSHFPPGVFDILFCTPFDRVFLADIAIELYVLIVIRKPPKPTTVTTATDTPAPQVEEPQAASGTSTTKFVAAYISIGTIIMCLLAAVVYRASRAQRVGSAEPTGPPGSYQRGVLDYLCPCFYRQGFQRVRETSGERTCFVREIK